MDSAIALSTVTDAAMRGVIRSGDRYAFFPLPALAGVLDEAYVDLRAIAYLPRVVIDDAPRRASASEDGAADLAAHIVAFFTRIPVTKLG